MDFLITALGFLGPAIIGSLTVPVFGGIKKIAKVLDRLPSPFQQMGALGVAGGLTWLSGTLNVLLPTELVMFSPDSVSALLAAAMAFGMHAGMKAKAK